MHGARPNESSKQFFEDLEKVGFPFDIKEPFSIWAMEPYPWLDSLRAAGLASVFTAEYFLFKRLSNKFSLFSEFLRFGDRPLQNFLRAQYSRFNYQFYWLPPSGRIPVLTTGAVGEGGKSHKIGFDRDRLQVTRGTDFCRYQIGLIQQSVVFNDGILHGPIGRTWSGQVGNLFRNEWIYYQPEISKLIDIDLLVSLQNHIAKYLQESGFRGCFSTDWLSDSDTKDLFLLEVNPRFSSDLCLFDHKMKKGPNSRTPLALAHLLATAEASKSEIPSRGCNYLSFEEFGGGRNRAYSPPTPHDDTRFGLIMAPEVPDEYLNRHTNWRLVKALS